jgi:multidrug transporter EmrE-like cation transporter
MTIPFSRKSLGHGFLLASLFFGMGAHLLLKFGMLMVHAQSSAWIPYLWVFGGLGVYALGTAFWMLCLGYLDLSYAYPFTALTYVMILGASWLLFNDVISFQRIAGVSVICLGVTLIPAGSRGSL